MSKRGCETSIGIIHSPFWRRTVAALFLAGVLLGIAPASVRAGVLPPPSTVCPSGPNPPVLPGSTPISPGVWWNPNHSGVGWTFNFTSDHKYLIATWYTFAPSGNPIWLTTPEAPLSSNSNGEQTWSADLQLFTYSFGTHTPSGTTVGSVAVTFVKNSTTAAAIQWQWNALGAQSHSECLYDYFRGTPPSTSSPTPANSVNESFTGIWYAPSSSGWGLDLTEGINGSTQYTENPDLELYDSSGQPVWVYGQYGPYGSPPPTTNISVPLYYAKSNYGSPTTDCSASSCVSLHALALNSYTRSFTDNTGGIVNLAINVPSAITGGAPLQWPPAGDPVITYPTPIAKLTDGNEISVSSPLCQAPPGQQTCSFQVSWTGPSAQTSIYRRDLNSNQLSGPLASGLTGQVTESLNVGSLVRYELFSGGAQIAYSTSVQVVAAPATGPSIPDPPQLAATPSDDLASDGVGSTAGQFSVDQSGNSQYRIPLYVPHGAGGLTPNLALVYNSGAGDGILGYGWQLEGLSSVAICRLSQEHGDGVRPVGTLTTIPSLTAYCLDGQRMDLVSGSNGVAGAVYRLENDSATEIVIENASTIDGRGSDTYPVPTIFAAYAKDGTVRRFGTLAAELRSPWGSNGATLAWYEYEIRDSNNNRIAFNYSAPSLSSPAALVPSSIVYSGGEIDFATSPRPVAQQSTSYQVWVGGAGIVTQPVWLTQITVKANGMTLRTYTPTYSTTRVINPALEEITSLQECAPGGAAPICYPPVNFDWADISALLGSGPLIQTYGKSDGEFSHVAQDEVKFADVDGDGRADTVFLHGDDGTLDFQDFLVSFSAPSKSSGIQLNTVDICNNGNYDPNGPCPQLSKFLRENKSWQLLDFDGDGRSDLLMLEPTLGNGDPNATPHPTYRIVVWKSTGGNTPNAATNPFTQKQLNIASDPQTGQLKAMTFPSPVDTFVSDFDGDGLPDLLTIGSNGGAEVWLLKPTGSAAQPYAFQGPYLVRIGTSANPSFCGLGSLSSQTLRTADFDGDGRADLVLRVSGNPCVPGAHVDGASAPGDQIQFLTAADFDAALARAGGVSTSGSIGTSSQTESVQVFTSGGVEGGTGGNWFDFLPSGLIWQVGSNLGVGPNKNMVDDSHFQVADINGDGLTDMMFAGDTIVNNSSVWLYELNQGGSREPSMCVVANSSGSGCAVSLGVSQTQLGDYDGDGKADFWTVEKWAASGSNTSVVHLWTGNGFSTTPIATNLFSGDIGTNPSWFGYLVDLDGDGHPDSLEINPTDGGGAWQTARNSAHHQPRNVVQTITSGLGAVTTLTYAPLTYTSLYYREYNASNLSSGWGSPVQDVLTPRYVVQHADSSAPTDGSPGAISTIRYQYSGFKMQGSGRGSLGFDKVYTTDAQTGVETVTAYNQAFPLTGTPSQTAVYTNGSSRDTVCAAPYGDPDSAACMGYGAATDLNANQQQLSLIRDYWSWHVFGATSDRSALTSAVPIFVFRQQTQAVKHDLDGTLLSSQATTFNYNPIYGEVLSTISNEYSQASMWSGNLVRQTNTTQTYQADVDIAPSAANAYAATWHVGRLTGSTTSVTGFGRESVNPAAYPTRTSSFRYDPVTGQLTEEHLQSGGSADHALTKYHVHDAFGNEVQTISCSDSTISQGHCSSALTATQMTFDASDPNWVQRYTRTGYDASGIYPTASYAPFSAGGVGAAEHATLTIDSRDAFGNPTRTTDANGVQTVGAYGAFGRPYFSATNAGGAVQTIYRWCAGHGSSAVSCPAGAAYRVDTNAGVGATSARAPESWAYYDVLARVVLNIKQGLAPTDFIAVSTAYDNLGRVHRVSEPYFTSSPTSSNVGAGAVYFTTSYYDSLGRVTSVTHPNGQQTTTSFGRDALGKPTTTVTLPSNVSPSNFPGYAEQTVQTRNHLGELITVADSLGSTLNNTYDAAGNLLIVTRAGWDGKSASAHMGYDAMGRKTSLNDPDAGTWTYAYNAAGEEVQKISATTCEQTFHDGQGRPWSRSDYASPTCGGAADASATWSYDTATSGVGELTTATSNDNGTLYTRQHAYDGFGRIDRVDTTISSGTTASYTEQNTYDPYGRPFQTLFSGNGIPQSGELYQYNPQGYHDVTRDAEYGLNGSIYLQTLAMDARGHVTQEERANNPALITARTYTPDMGRLSDIVTAGGAIQKLHYDYDALGNVEDRRDTSGGAPGGTANIYETYAYDPLQRLTTTQFLQSNGSTVSSTNAYDSLGNFQSGTYGGQGSGCTGAGEVAAGPDAIVTIGSNTFCYDAHGNQTRSLDPANSQGLVKRQQSWSAFDALRTVDLANWYISHTTKWAYGPEHQRLVRQDYTNATGSGPPNVIHYVGNAEIITAPGSTQRIVKRYLPGLILSQTVANNATQAVQYEYLFTDNLGSTHGGDQRRAGMGRVRRKGRRDHRRGHGSSVMVRVRSELDPAWLHRPRADGRDRPHPHERARLRSASGAVHPGRSVRTKCWRPAKLQPLQLFDEQSAGRYRPEWLLGPSPARLCARSGGDRDCGVYGLLLQRSQSGYCRSRRGGRERRGRDRLGRSRVRLRLHRVRQSQGRGDRRVLGRYQLRNRLGILGTRAAIRKHRRACDRRRRAGNVAGRQVRAWFHHVGDHSGSGAEHRLRKHVCGWGCGQCARRNDLGHCGREVRKWGTDGGVRVLVQRIGALWRR